MKYCPRCGEEGEPFEGGPRYYQLEQYQSRRCTKCKHRWAWVEKQEEREMSDIDKDVAQYLDYMDKGCRGAIFTSEDVTYRREEKNGRTVFVHTIKTLADAHRHAGRDFQCLSLYNLPHDCYEYLFAKLRGPKGNKPFLMKYSRDRK